MMTMMVVVVRQLKATNGNTITLPQYIEFGISSQIFPLNSNYSVHFLKLHQKPRLSPTYFQVERFEKTTLSTDDWRHDTLDIKGIQQTTSSTGRTGAVSRIRRTYMHANKVPSTIPEFRTTSRWTLTLNHLSKSSEWRYRS